nr:ORF1 [Torque teno felis virus]
MFYRRRKRRWTRRHGRRRRWRHWGRSRRYWRRGGRWRRRVTRRFVTQWVPGRHRLINVRGWEPLANLCDSDCAKTEAKPYLSIEPQGGGQGVWHGTWGKHYFTPGNLLARAKAKWCVWSEDWASYDYIQFYGGWVKIPQTAQTTWMITFDEYLETAIKGYNPTEHEDKWGHPGMLLNVPKTHIIFPYNQNQRRRWYKIPIKPPPGWRGIQRFPEAFSYILCHWLWTWCDLQHAFYDISTNKPDASSCEIAPWWASNNKLDTWVDRSTYKDCSSVLTGQETWGPFLPSRYSNYETSVFFTYKLYFKVIGNAIWRPLPRNFLSEGLVPDPKPAPSSETRSSGKKRARPQSEADIWPGDLDSDGLLTEEAYNRIVGDNPRHKRRKLGGQGRLRLIAKKLRFILQQHKLLS